VEDEKKKQPKRVAPGLESGPARYFFSLNYAVLVISWTYCARASAEREPRSAVRRAVWRIFGL
jgi:hypothetical protein